MPVQHCMTSTGLAGWARDIPLKAFGRKRLPIVTAPSSAHLYCMRILLEDGSLSPDAQVGRQCQWWAQHTCFKADIAD